MSAGRAGVRDDQGGQKNIGKGICSMNNMTGFFEEWSEYCGHLATMDNIVLL
jgi:hypothetical protein